MAVRSRCLVDRFVTAVRRLLQARKLPGLEDPDGVDTLLLHLLADLRAGADIEVHIGTAECGHTA